MLESFAHPDEKTTEACQVRLDGQALIKNQKEQWLEKRALALLVRAFPDLHGDADEDPDAVLTHAGFRNGACNLNLPGARQAFVLRLVGLQLLIRRGMEVSQLFEAQQGEQRFPLYGHDSTEDHNTASWPNDLADAEVPGTAIKQTLSKQQQRTNKRLREPVPHDGDADKEPDFRRLCETLKEKHDQRTGCDFEQPPAKKHKSAQRPAQGGRKGSRFPHPLIENFSGGHITHPGVPPIAPDGTTERLNDPMATSCADNTIASCTSKMNLFMTFLTRHQLMLTRWNGSAPTMPTVTPTTLMFFCSFMPLRGFKSAGSIAGCCTAVKQ